MNFDNNPNFELPGKIARQYAHFDLTTRKFRGTASYDGQYGGVPLMYDAEHERLIVDGTDTHTLVFGSSGSKKTRAVVLPTIHMLMHAEESMIIHDAKGELYKRTATFLEKAGYRVIAVNFRQPELGHAWNPLMIPYHYYKEGDLDKAAEFANDVASTITLGNIADSKDPFWDHSAHDCAFGLMLLLFRYCRENDLPDSAVNMANLATLRRALFENGVNTKTSWLWRWGSKDELIAASLSGTVMTAMETMQGILSVLDQKLRTFTINSALMDMLANSSFEIEPIGREKTAVFLITPDEKTSYHSLVAIFVSQSYQHLIYSAERAGGRVAKRINYILDEFSSLPAIGSDFPSMITAARSRNIRFLIVAQSKNQLVRRYQEEASTIMANCTNWFIMFTRELELLKEVSELCGTKRNGTPNISVFDLQHLSKERNQVLLLAGRMKPAVVNLADIRRLDSDRICFLEYATPIRAPRYKLDFDRVPPAIMEQLIPRTSLEAHQTIISKQHELFRTSSWMSEEKDDMRDEKEEKSESRFNFDDLITKIDKKIAELEKEETAEAQMQKAEGELEAVVAEIEKRRNELVNTDDIVKLSSVDGGACYGK